MASTVSAEQKVLYLIVCAAPPATHVHELIPLAQDAGWDVCVVATPEATKFIDAQQLATATHHPVRSEYKMPGEDDVVPKPDAIVVVPATFNTINKWALGIADTLALGLLCEHLGHGTPMVAVPCLKADLASHPAFLRSIRLLKQHRVNVLYEPHKYVSPRIPPWRNVLDTVMQSIECSRFVSSKDRQNNHRRRKTRQAASM